MTYDLNAMGIVRNEREWLKVMHTWADVVESEAENRYQQKQIDIWMKNDEFMFFFSSTNAIVLSDEDERLQEHIKQMKNWVSSLLFLLISSFYNP